MMLTVLIRLLAVLSALACAAPALAIWHKAESRNFVIYGDMPADQLREEALRLENFDQLLRRRFGITDERQQYPLTIYIVARRATVNDMAGNPHIVGFYRPDRFGSFALTSSERIRTNSDAPVEDVLLHEYGHHFQMRHVDTPRPPWFIEGFAQYFATATLSKNGEWQVGRPPANRAIGLLPGVRMPIRKMLTEDMASFDGAETLAMYSRAWVLTHYLNSSAERQAQLDRYLAALGRGETRLAAAEQAFGDLDSLDRALESYARKRLISVIYNSFGTYQGPLKVTQLDAVSAQLVMPTIQRRSGRYLPEARAAVEALVTQAPASPDAWFELALIQRDMALANADQAQRTELLRLSEASADKVLAIQPRHVRANVLKADYRLRALQASRETDPAKWRDARAFLLTANEAALDDPAPMVAWHQSFLRQGRVPSQTAHDGLAKAFSIQPEVPELRIAYAFDLARLGRFDAALRVADVLAADPHRAGAAAAALRRIAAMRRGESPADEPQP